jgi:DNA (cytosine-5)-methyltransferase 1
MAVYYNENDSRMAAWLKEAIKMKLIAPGEVDTRSIKDVDSADIKPFTQRHFFAGIGTWSYALKQAGWDDDREVLTGSCPCTPFSTAGQQQGFDDPSHLSPDMVRLIRELRPRTIFGEQVASEGALQWWDLVASDLEAENYSTTAMDLPAASIGAFHQRSRLFWVAERLANTNEPKSTRGFTRSSGQGNESDGQKSFPKSSGSSSTWDDADTIWLQCRDGNFRPTHRDINPLVGLTAMDAEQIGVELARSLEGLVPGRNINERRQNARTAARRILAQQNRGSIKSRIAALADGTPSGVRHSSDQSITDVAEVQNTQEARMMRLFGYGNAIDTRVAIEFITTFMER